MSQSGVLYVGKMKQLLAGEDPEQIVVRFTDAASAFNHVKQAVIAGKGRVTCAISSWICDYLKRHGVKTHFLEQRGECDQLCRKVQVIPLEVITRNVIAGTISSYLGVEEGSRPENTLYELCLKNDELDDPLINDHHAVALGIVTYEELKEIYALTAQINELLVDLFAQIGIELVDFKVEFGRMNDGTIVLADEVSPDTCRLWDKATGERLDRDRFRYDLGHVREAYEEILNRLQKLN